MFASEMEQWILEISPGSLTGNHPDGMVISFSRGPASEGKLCLEAQVGSGINPGLVVKTTHQG